MVTPIEFMKYWNSKPTLTPIRALTAKRITGLRNKCKEPEFIKHWKYVIDMAATLPFYQGQNDRKWKANVDWMLVVQDGWLKLLERYPPETTTVANTTTVQTKTPRELAMESMR